jgi:hypothetical protein
MIAIIAILIAAGNLMDPLSQQLEQCMIRVSRGPRIVNFGCRGTEDAEALINLPHDKKACIGSDLCSLKINAYGAVKFRPYGPCPFVTNRAHKLSPSPDEFGA